MSGFLICGFFLSAASAAAAAFEFSDDIELDVFLLCSDDDLQIFIKKFWLEKLLATVWNVLSLNWLAVARNKVKRY